MHLTNRQADEGGFVPAAAEDQSPLSERDEMNESPRSNLEELPNPFRVLSSRLETDDTHAEEDRETRSSHYDEESDSASYPSIMHAPAEESYPYATPVKVLF